MRLTGSWMHCVYMRDFGSGIHAEGAVSRVLKVGNHHGRPPGSKVALFLQAYRYAKPFRAENTTGGPHAGGCVVSSSKSTWSNDRIHRLMPGGRLAFGVCACAYHVKGC